MSIQLAINLYRNILGREPENEQVVNDIAKQIQLIGYEPVKQAFLNSPELAQKSKDVAKQFYNNILGREPENEQVVNTWAEQIRQLGVAGAQNAFTQGAQAELTSRLTLLNAPAPAPAPAPTNTQTTTSDKKTMAWVTFEDLLAKAGVTGASRERVDPFGAKGSAAPVFNASNLKGLSKNEEGALGELYSSAVEVMKQAGVPPDSVRQISYVTDSGDFSYEIPNWNLETIKETLNSRGVKLAYDPSRDEGNWGSSRGHSIQLGVLDAAGKPVQEYRVGEGSLASGFFKGFVVPFAQIALTANASAIGAAIAPTASSTVQSAIGSAVASGAGTALAGGDAEDVIKNALTGGAVGAASSLVKPYIQDAIDFVKDLAPGDLEQVANSVDATAGPADVARDLGAVDVGGATDEGVIRLARYNDLRAMGMPDDVAMAQVASEMGLQGPITAPATGNIANALAGTTAETTPSVNAMTGEAITPTAVTSTPPVATVDLTGGQGVYDPYTGLAENLPVGDATGAVTDAGLGTAAAGAGAVGAAGAAGAAGASAGGVMTEADLAGLDPNLTLGAGTDVLGGTDATGGGVGAGAATGAITAGGAAAAGLTGIKAVDDFLSYLGTPAGSMALSAFGGLAGGYFQGQAAKEAAQTQAAAADRALKLQQDMFDYQKSLLAPYQEVGVNALRRLEGVMGLGGQPATGGQQLLEMDPGYAFRLGEGMKALERLQAARGNMLSGGAIKAGQRYAQDVASQEYGSAYNRLANIAGLGQTTGTQLGAAGQQFGATAGETMAQQANALAAGRVGRTSAYTQGINTAANAFGNFANQQQQNQLFRDIYGRAFGG